MHIFQIQSSMGGKATLGPKFPKEAHGTQVCACNMDRNMDMNAFTSACIAVWMDERLMCGSGGARTHGTPMRAVTGLISLQADGTDLIQRRGCRGEGTLEGAKEERNHRKGKGSSGPKGCRAEAEWAWGR